MNKNNTRNNNNLIVVNNLIEKSKINHLNLNNKFINQMN